MGGKKQGIGAYQYPRKAKYEGEWQNNVKDGFGVYHFAKGGLYKVSLAVCITRAIWICLIIQLGTLEC